MQRQTPNEAQAVFDADDLMARCLGNLEFAEHILAMFQTRFGEDLGALDEVVARGDVESVVHLAHRLKGAAANAAAPGLKALAAEIEQLAHARNLQAIPTRLADLKEEWAWFRETASLWAPGVALER